MNSFLKHTLLYGAGIYSLIALDAQAQNSKGWGSPEKPTFEAARAFVEHSLQNQKTLPKGLGSRSESGLSGDVMASASLGESAAAGSALRVAAFAVTAGGNTADQITPEIQNLTDALDHDPVKIFEYVHNFIGYEDYFGSKKGAHLTLLEGSGNSFDQSALFVALLRAGGHSPQYKYGSAIFSYTELTRWMGLDAAPFSHLTDSQFLAENGLSPSTPSSQIPALRKKFAVFFFFDAHGYFHFESITSGNEEFIVLPHLWVSLTHNGVTYDKLSPAWKDYTSYTGIGLAAATGYSRANFLDAAGGTVSSPDAVRSLNYSGISSLLTTYSANMLSHLKQNHSTRAVERITGTRKINAISISALDQAREIFTWDLSSDWITSATWGAIPDIHISKLIIQLGYNWNPTTKTWGTLLSDNTANPLRMTDLRGKKLSLSFSGNTASVRLDEQLLGNTVNVTAGTVQMRLLATHNHYSLTRQSNGTYLVTKTGKSDQETVDIYKKGNTFAYAFPYTFGNTEKQLRVSQEKLDSYLRSNVASTDWRVITESLNIMGLNWMYQTYLQSEALAPIYGIITMDHHRMGRCSQEGGIYIDVGLIFSANRSKISKEEDQNEFNYLSSFFASAMEHGIIEQLQGTGVSAVSTVRLLHMTNQNGKKLYRATGANWNSINTTANLSNYTVTLKNEIQAAVVTNGGKGLIPQDANITSGQWTGIGYALQQPTSIAMKISGDLFGGYGSNLGGASVDEILRYLRSDPSYILGSGAGVKKPYAPYTTPRLESTDPVDMASGAFFLEKEEITIGAGAGVRGLGFTRHYNSNRRYDNSFGLGYGWTHDCDIRLAKRSSVKAGMGQTISYHAVPFYVAAHVASDLYRNHTNAKEWATSMLAVNWFCDQLRYNAVAVSLGNKTIEFVRMPDGSYEAPANMNLTLTSTGSGASETFTMTERHGSTHAFDSSGKITTTTDQWGKVKTFTYSAEKLTKVTDAYGRALNFTWAGDRINSVADAHSRTVAFQYTGDDLTGCTDVEGKTWGYAYDTEHRMTRTIDPSLRTVIENTYDSEGRVSRQLSYGDASKPYTLRYTGYCNTEENPQSGKRCFLFDARGRAIGTIDALGNGVSKAYDGHDRGVVDIDPESNAVFREYDRHNNLTFTIDQAGEITDLTYDPALRVATINDKRGQTTAYNSYSAQHLPLRITAPGNRATDYIYTAAGESDTITDPEGNITDNDYNALGQLVKSRLNGEVSAEFTYNAYGDVATSKDGLGRTTAFTYNKRRQLLTTTTPSIAGEPAAVVTLTYDNEGLLQTTTDPRGNITTQTYTATGQPLTTTAPAIPTTGGMLNNVITNSYDTRDWLESTADSLGRQTRIIHDSAQRPVVTRDPLNRLAATAYDKNSRPLQVTDPLNRVTAVAYSPRGEALTQTDAMDKDTTQVFDANGNHTHRTNRRGKTHVFTFDAANRATASTTPTGKATITEYFKNDLVKSITEPSTQKTTFTYDTRLRPLTKADPVGTVTYGYNNADQLTSVTEGAATITRTYDERGRLKTYTNADGDLIQYRYDANGNLTKLTYPDGKQVTYTYNARNLLETVTDWAGRVTTYRYDRLGRLTGTIRPNGTANIIAHDAANQLTSIKETAGGKLISYLKFDYDLAAQITRRFRAPLVNSGWQHPSFAATYDHDNRLATINGQSVTHDADGNMTFGPIRQDSGRLNLTYNSRNQLTNADGLAYTYDAEGTRRTLTDTSGTIRDVIDPNGSLSRLLVRHHPDGSITRYVYGLGLLYEVDEDENTKTHHYDQVGSTIARTDDTGKVIGKAEYSAFGITFWKQGDMETPFLYNGQAGVQTDPNGLLNMRARYYSPFLMRFLNADPIGFSGGSNWFAYADGNPISRNDPFGLFSTFGEYVGEVGDVWKGYGDAAVGTVTGLYNVVAHPIQTAKGVGQAISHPVQAYNNISETVSELSQTNRGMGRIMGEVFITAATAGGGLASGTTKTANIMRSSQASGMTVRQALRAYDVGSKALNAADYTALGGRATTALEKAALINAGYQITTTPIQGFIQSLKLAPTGLTPAGDFFVGAWSTTSALGRAGNHAK